MVEKVTPTPQQMAAAGRAWGKAVQYLPESLESIKGLREAVTLAMSDLTNAPFLLKSTDIVELARVRYPNEDILRAVFLTGRDFRRGFAAFTACLARRASITTQIVERTQAIESGRNAAQAHYDKLVAKLSKEASRLHAPEFNAKPLILEIDTLKKERTSIDAYLAVGTFDRLPEELRCNPAIMDAAVGRSWEAYL